MILKWLWPTIGDHVSAQRMTKRSYYVATVLSSVLFFSAFLAIYGGEAANDHRLDFIDGLFLMVFGFLVKSNDPFFAGMIFLSCVFEVVVRFQPILLPVWLVLLVVTAHGVKGAFWLVRASPLAAPNTPETAEGAESTRAVTENVGALEPVLETPRFFSLSGRLDRQRYLIYSLLVGVVSYALFRILVGATMDIGMDPLRRLLMLILAAFVPIALLLMLTVQRCHDFDRSGWRAIFLFLPFSYLAFLAVPSQPYRNTYGLPNPPKFKRS